MLNIKTANVKTMVKIDKDLIEDEYELPFGSNLVDCAKSVINNNFKIFDKENIEELHIVLKKHEQE